MSTSSGAKSRPPAHQNAFAFRHNRRSKLTDRIDRTVDTDGLCGACSRKIEWRKKYRKYKPLTVPRRCNRCHAKRVFHAYHTLCGTCAEERNACAVCESALLVGGDKSALVDMDDARVVALVESLSERERRTVLRLVDRGALVSDALRKIGLTLVAGDASRQVQSSLHVHQRGAENVTPHSDAVPIASVREEQ